MQEQDDYGQAVDLRVLHKGFPKFWGEGFFSASLCRGCGYTCWSAYDIGALAPSSFYGVSDVSGACAGCAGKDRCRVRVVRETGSHGHSPMAVVLERGLLFSWAAGGFEVVVCRGCGLVEWYAYGIETLKPDPASGISLVEPAAAPPEGPYR
jgi:hypothetical protein